MPIPRSKSRKRGRPPKFGRPSRVVALTLPDHTVRDLKKVHRDLAWAIVTVVDKRPAASGERDADGAELVAIGDQQYLIVVNRAIVRRLPGVHIIPLNGNRAFLALDPGHGLADLELAVRDRLEQPSLGARERRALAAFRALLSKWRRDRTFQVRQRTIIVVERASRRG